MPPDAGTRMVLPPDATMATPSLDRPRLTAELPENGPGPAERFETHGMHTTATVDHTVVDGEIRLESDNSHLSRRRDRGSRGSRPRVSGHDARRGPCRYFSKLSCCPGQPSMVRNLDRSETVGRSLNVAN